MQGRNSRGFLRHSRDEFWISERSSILLLLILNVTSCSAFLSNIWICSGWSVGVPPGKDWFSCLLLLDDTGECLHLWIRPQDHLLYYTKIFLIFHPFALMSLKMGLSAPDVLQSNRVSRFLHLSTITSRSTIGLPSSLVWSNFPGGTLLHLVLSPISGHTYRNFLLLSFGSRVFFSSDIFLCRILIWQHAQGDALRIQCEEAELI